MAFGFLKCLAGGLLCIVPIPGARIVGGGLIINGVNDCIDSAREVGEENERKQKMNPFPEYDH